MSEHRRADRYEQAIKVFEEHLVRTGDGVFRLEVSDSEDGHGLGIDPVVFADLKRSLDETNRMLRRGEIKIDQVQMYVRTYSRS